MQRTQYTSDKSNHPPRRAAHLVLGIALCVALGLASLPPAVGDELQYAVTDLGPIPGKPRVEAYWNGLNNRGQVTGFGYSTVFTDEVAFVWDGELQILPTLPNTAFHRAHSLNDQGQIVGEIAFNFND